MAIIVFGTATKLISILLALILSFSLFNGKSEKEPEIINLGIPTESVYTEEKFYKARSVWDMAVLDDKLYIGCGDYDKNSGAVTLFCYDIEKGEWTDFYLSEGKLYAPGFDAVSSTWEYGNYHILTDGKWQSITHLPNAVHNFDIIKYNGNLFFGIGTEKSEISPVKMLDDDGNYISIPFKKNGEDMLYEGNSFNRVYDFFIANGELYCNLFKYGVTQILEFYKYNGQEFEFVSSDDSIDYKIFKQNPVSGWATYNGICYFSVGNLYKTNDFVNFEQVNMPNGAYVSDLLVETGRFTKCENMYLLTTILNEDKAYSTAVYRYTAEGGFKELASLVTDGPAISLAKHGNDFFIGLGKTENTEIAQTAGTVIKIEF